MKLLRLVGCAAALSALAGGLTDACTAAPAPAKVPALRQGLAIEDLGAPVKRRELRAATVVTNPADGVHHLFVVVSAFNGFENDTQNQFLDFNLTTGEVRSSMSGCINGDGRTWMHPNGKMYMAGGRPASLIEFDPATGKSRYIGNLTSNFYHAVQSVDLAPDGTLVFGHYGCHISRYNPATDKIEDLGVLGPEANKYIYTIAADERYIYGSYSDGWYAVVYDTQTKTQEAFHNITGTADHRPDGTIWIGKQQMYQGRAVTPDKVDEANRNAKPRPANRAMDLVQAGEKLGLEFDLSELNPNHWNGGHVQLSWRQKDAAEWRKASFEGIDVVPNGPAILVPMPDGKLMGGASHYGPLFIFDPATRQAELIAATLPSSPDAWLIKDKVGYLSGYSSAFWVWDRTKPWTVGVKNTGATGAVTNPRNLTGAGKWPLRVLEAADGRIYTGGNHGRHLVGAEFNVYDPAQDKFVESYRQDMEPYYIQDIVLLNQRQNLAIVATARADQQKMLFVYDVPSKQIVRRLPFKIDSNDPGLLLPAGTDRVVGVTRAVGKDAAGAEVPETLLYELNTATGEVLSQQRVPGRAFSGPEATDYDSGGRWLEQGPDGCGWMTIGKELVRIKPDATVEKVMDLPHGARMVFVGDDLYLYNGGRRWYGGFASIWRVKDVLAK